MRRRLLIWLLLLSVAAFAAAGSFAGVVMKGPVVESGRKWLYVQARRGATRRVEITSAKIRFGEDVPRKSRTAKPEDALCEGVQVRVTASQDAEGEWKASVIDIVKAAE